MAPKAPPSRPADRNRPAPSRTAPPVGLPVPDEPPTPSVAPPEPPPAPAPPPKRYNVRAYAAGGLVVRAFTAEGEGLYLPDGRAEFRDEATGRTITIRGGCVLVEELPAPTAPTPDPET